MKRISFRKLTIQNFLSVGEEPVIIEFHEGTNIITGFNRDENDIKNAVGKSAVCAAFFFAIFGTTPNDIPKQFIPNRKIGRNCKVTLEFEDVSTNYGQEYFVIERSLVPNKVRVWKNDIDKTKSTIPENNKYIRDVLSADEDIFINCVIQSANDSVPFMGKKKTERKHFIESIFNLSVFSDMLKLLKDDIRETKHGYDVEKSAMTVIEGNVKNYEEQIKTINEEIASRSMRLKMEMDALNSRISKEDEKLMTLEKKCSTTPEDVTEKMAKLKEAKQKLVDDKTKLYGKEVEIKTRVSSLGSEYKRIEKIGNACPTCGRAYDEDMVNNNSKRLSEISEEVSKLNAGLALVRDKQREIAAKVSKCDSMAETIERARKEYESTMRDIEFTKKTIKMYQEQLKNLPEKHKEDTSVKIFEDMLKNAGEELEEKKKVVDGFERSIGRMNVCEHILGEFGVRSYIVNKLLDLLNGRIRYYLGAFKSTYKFTFNEFFEEEIKDVNGMICTYSNLSGAERKKVDLAISFSFIDILKLHSQTEYNVTFFDEILDSSVDSKSLEHIMDFISEQAEENHRAIYIVTHKSDVAVPRVKETIILEKKNGFTTRMES